MRALIIVCLTVCAGVIQTGIAAALGNSDQGPGCGLGKLAWSDYGGQKQIAPQVFMATTNGTFGSQTFGISFGTSGCTNDGVIMKNKRIDLAARTFDSLKQEMAQGQGEHLTSLATLLGIAPEDQPDSVLAQTASELATGSSVDLDATNGMPANTFSHVDDIQWQTVTAFFHPTLNEIQYMGKGASGENSNRFNHYIFDLESETWYRPMSEPLYGSGGGTGHIFQATADRDTGDYYFQRYAAVDVNVFSHTAWVSAGRPNHTQDSGRPSYWTQSLSIPMNGGQEANGMCIHPNCFGSGDKGLVVMAPDPGFVKAYCFGNTTWYSCSTEVYQEPGWATQNGGGGVYCPTAEAITTRPPAAPYISTPSGLIATKLPTGYKRFLDETGHRAPFVDTEWARPYNWINNTYPPGKGDFPVVLVSWDDAAAYAGWAGKRLPTEAEWEMASRGGLVKKKYPWGDIIDDKHANYFTSMIASSELKPVGSFPANPFGLYDVAGNVWEWCADWYWQTYYRRAPEANPRGPEEGLYRVFRGGSWVNRDEQLRCSERARNVPSHQSHIIGFRCARSAAGKESGAQDKPGEQKKPSI